MYFKLSKLVFYTLLISVSLRLFLSNWLLDGLYPYTLPEGQWFYKIHPGSIIALAVFSWVVLVRSPIRFFEEQRKYNFSAYQFFVIIILIALYSVLRHGTSGGAYLVDTFLISAVFLMLAVYITQHQRKQLVRIVIVIVSINSIIAVIEFITNTHLFEPQKIFGFFRSSALFGHPLTNGLITASIAVAVLKMNWNWLIKSGIISLMIFSLFAFGARGSLGFLVLGLALFFIISPFLMKGSNRLKLLVIPVSQLLLVLLLGLILFIVFQTEFGSTIATRFMMDDSAELRLYSLSLINYFTLSEILWGLDYDNLLYLFELNPYVTTVENFWVVLLLNLGLPVFLLFVVSFFSLIYRQVRQGNWMDSIIVLVFILAASTNNSLSSKSAALAVFLLVIFCLRDSNIKSHKRI